MSGREGNVTVTRHLIADILLLCILTQLHAESIAQAFLSVAIWYLSIACSRFQNRFRKLAPYKETDYRI